MRRSRRYFAKQYKELRRELAPLRGNAYEALEREDELIEMYYGEGTSAAKLHLEACRECSRKNDEFTRSMEEIQSSAVPQRRADYGESVWQTLRPLLIPFEKKKAAWAGWRAAAMAVGCAMLLAAVFLGGRYWERNTTKQSSVTNSPQTTQRVVLVVLSDHLDRTERLLVQLEHSQAPDTNENAQLQVQARELLASNRLYRVTASDAGDPALAGALDRLEGVLAEIKRTIQISLQLISSACAKTWTPGEFCLRFGSCRHEIRIRERRELQSNENQRTICNFSCRRAYGCTMGFVR